MTQQFRTVVAKGFLYQSVHFSDFPVTVGHYDGIGRRFEEGPITGFAQSHCIFGFSALGEIARDLRESKQISALIPNGGDNHVGPETRTIFSNPPSFVLEFSLRCCYFQFSVGFAAVNFFTQVEPRKMLAYNFLLCVTLNSFRSDIPGGNSSLRIEHKNRVVRNAFHQVTEYLITLM